MAWTERYVRADAAGGGDGTTDSNSGANGAYTLAEAMAVTTPNGIRFNVKSGTYTCNSSATRSFSQTISAGAACCFRGFNTTIGDLDNETDPTNFPSLEASTGHFNLDAARYWLRNIRFLSNSGTAETAALNIFANQGRVHNCRMEMTNGSRYGFQTNGTGDYAILYRSHAIGTARAVSFSANAEASCVGCFANGYYGYHRAAPGTTAFCIAHYSSGGAAGFYTTSQNDFFQNTSYIHGNPGAAGASSGSTSSIFANNLLVNSETYGIIGDFSHLADNSNLWSIRNTHYNHTSGNTADLPEDQEWEPTTASAQPMVDPANGDYSLNPNGDAIQAAGFYWLDFPKHQDKFTGSSGTTIQAHDSRWVKHPSYTTGNIILSNANRAIRDGLNTNIYYYDITPVSADYEVSIDIYAASLSSDKGYPGVLARCSTTALTWYRAQWAGNEDKWQLHKAVGGSGSLLAEVATTLTATQTYNLKLVVQGSSIKVYVDGVLTLQATDSDITAAGKPAIRIGGGGVVETNTTLLHIDNFKYFDYEPWDYSDAGAVQYGSSFTIKPWYWYYAQQ